MTKKIEYQKRVALGLCLQCGKFERAENKKNCLACNKKLAERYKKNREKGICVNCGLAALPNKTRCQSCGDKQKELTQTRRSAWEKKKLCKKCGRNAVIKKSHCDICLNNFKKLRKERKSLGLCQACGAAADGKSRCARCLEINKKSMYRLKLEVFTAYGGAFCKCCGDSHIEFLALDHMGNDGAEHRRQVTNSGVYRSLRQKGFPKGYQVLCHNCNWAKYAYGECPHQKERKNVVARPC